MDRFIGFNRYCIYRDSVYLKSNMDRFIAAGALFGCSNAKDLKSNMDRFIDWSYCRYII